MKRITLTALAAIAYIDGIIPTVTVSRDGVAVRINECDFDPETMELFDAPAEPQPETPPAVPPAPDVSATIAPAPVLLVMKQAGKFFICDALGNKVEGEAATALGILDTGYTTEAKAQAALAAIKPEA